MTISVVTLNGDLDFSRKGELISLLQRADKADVAIIDLSEASFIDSSCLSCLAAQKKRMQDNGTAAIIRVAGANPSLRRIFEICGLDKSFEIYTSVDEARNARLSQADSGKSFVDAAQERT